MAFLPWIIYLPWFYGRAHVVKGEESDVQLVNSFGIFNMVVGDVFAGYDFFCIVSNEIKAYCKNYFPAKGDTLTPVAIIEPTLPGLQ